MPYASALTAPAVGESIERTITCFFLVDPWAPRTTGLLFSRRGTGSPRSVAPGLCAAEAAAGLGPGGAALALGIPGDRWRRAGATWLRQRCTKLRPCTRRKLPPPRLRLALAAAAAVFMAGRVPRGRERWFDRHAGQTALDGRGPLAENGAPYGPGLEAAGIRSRAADHGRRCARARCAVGDGRGVALPRGRA